MLAAAELSIFQRPSPMEGGDVNMVVFLQAICLLEDV